MNSHTIIHIVQVWSTIGGFLYIVWLFSRLSRAADGEIISATVLAGPVIWVTNLIFSWVFGHRA